MIGIGLNIAAQGLADLASGFASLSEIDAAATPATALARVAPALIAAVREFERAGFAAFADRFASARSAARPRDRGRSRAATPSRGIGRSASPPTARSSSQSAAGGRLQRRVSGEWRLAAGRARRIAVLRSLLAALVVANLLFFAFTRGWFDGLLGLNSLGDREPERLATQVQPETIRSCCRWAPRRVRRARPAAAASRRRRSAAADAPAAEAILASNLPAGAWTDVRGERPLAGTRTEVTHSYRVSSADAALAAAWRRSSSTPPGAASAPARRASGRADARRRASRRAAVARASTALSSSSSQPTPSAPPPPEAAAGAAGVEAGGVVVAEATTTDSVVVETKPALSVVVELDQEGAGRASA